jgi:hypothetical protein
MISLYGIKKNTTKRSKWKDRKPKCKTVLLGDIMIVLYYYWLIACLYYYYASTHNIFFTLEKVS